MDLRLSVLDQSPIRAGTDAATALGETIALAQHVESLGFERYWLAEHHGSSMFAGASPEILITRVAAATSRIRVGSGGVMLVHYSPYKVAENFRVLETLFPGRIDLGIGRAPGSDGLSAAALAYGSPAGIDYLPAKLGDLQAFLTGNEPLTDGLSGVKVTPVPPPHGDVVGAPEMWMLGSSPSSAALAAYFGLPFSFAHFINAPELVASCETYVKHFRPSAMCSAPRINLAVFAICAATAEEAEDIALCRAVWRSRIKQGQGGQYPSVEEARAHVFSSEERAEIESRRAEQLIGDALTVKTRLDAMAKSIDAREVVVLSITPTFAQRLKSYELLARAYGLV